jgi:hypothetical protein
LEKYLGTAFAAVGAADELDVATAVLVTTTIPALESLQMRKERLELKKGKKKKKKIEEKNGVDLTMVAKGDL